MRESVEKWMSCVCLHQALQSSFVIIVPVLIIAFVITSDGIYRRMRRIRFHILFIHSQMVSRSSGSQVAAYASKRNIFGVIEILQRTSKIGLCCIVLQMDVGYCPERIQFFAHIWQLQIANGNPTKPSAIFAIYADFCNAVRSDVLGDKISVFQHNHTALFVNRLISDYQSIAGSLVKGQNQVKT